MRSVLPAFGVLAACSFKPGEPTSTPRDAAAIDDMDDATEIDAAMIDVAPDAARCPADFVSIGAGTAVYKAIIIPQAYANAVTVCSALGPNVRLARLDTQAQTNALYTFMDDAITVGDTNFTRVVGQRHANGAGPGDDTWHDLDDITLLAFTPWGAGEPTSAAGENCATLRAEFTVQTNRVTGADDCTTPRPFACECE